MRLWPGASSIEQFVRDVRFGLRSLRRTPVLTGMVLLSLALGIGATTAIFSTVYSVFLDAFPYGDAQHLMLVTLQDNGQRSDGFSTDHYLDLFADTTAFTDLAGSIWSRVAITGADEPRRLEGVTATPNLFRVLAVQPLLGRGFLESDPSDGQAVVVLSYKCWQSVFGGDLRVLGRQVRIDDEVRMIVGVMPERVYWLEADVYLPTTFLRGHKIKRGDSVLVLGRLKKGMTQARAEADLQSVFADIAHREPGKFPGHAKAKLIPLPEAYPTTIRGQLFLLLGAVGLLLTIACANVSSILLSKASARQKEMAIRASLGAGRGQIVRQLLTESLLLALAGCVLGLLVASLGLRLILAIVPSGVIPIEAKISLNPPALLFSLGVAFAAAVFTGLAPALHAARELAGGLRESSRGAGGSRKQAAVRQGLVVAEVALSMVVLVAAGQTLRTLFALQYVPLGITTEHVLTMDMPFSDNRYKNAGERVLGLRRFLDTIRLVPGVLGASVNTRLHPFDHDRVGVEIVGRSERDEARVVLQQVDEQYFTTLRIPLLTGRAWSEEEVRDKRNLALVNQRFARQYLTGRAVLGAAVHIPELKAMVDGQPFEIIGVTGDVLNQGLAKSAAPEIYIPYTFSGSSQKLAVRTTGDPIASSRAVLAAIHQVDPQQPVAEVMSLESLINRYLLSLSRFQMVLFGLFASIGLALAVAGIYGVVSNVVQSRTPELGLRLALGARREQVLGLVLASGMRLVLVGIGLGLIGALLVARFTASIQFGIQPADPTSYGVVSLVLGAVGLGACLWPALRAARINPMGSLRQE